MRTVAVSQSIEGKLRNASGSWILACNGIKVIVQDSCAISCVKDENGRVRVLSTGNANALKATQLLGLHV